MNASDYTGPKRRYAACWPRVMQVGLIADAEIRISDKYPAVNRLSDVRVPAVWRYAARAVGADRDMLVSLLFVRPLNGGV
jgi:hypothetical protein